MKINLQDIDETNIFDNYKKEEIYTKLSEQLNNQDYLMSKTSKKYLQDLLDFKYSVFNNELDLNQRNNIANLDIYKKINVFNTYYKALEILKKYDKNILIVDNYVDNLSAYTNDNGLIKLIYSLDYVKNNVDITLNRLVSNANKIKQIEDTIKYLKNSLYYDRIYGGNIWKEHIEQIASLEKELQIVKANNKLNAKYSNVLLNNEIVDLFANEYGLKNSNDKDIKIRRKELPNLRVEIKLQYK